jgi:hypothetical protein
MKFTIFLTKYGHHHLFEIILKPIKSRANFIIFGLGPNIISSLLMSFIEIKYEIKLIMIIESIGTIQSILDILSPENRRITRVIGDILATTDLLDI